MLKDFMASKMIPQQEDGRNGYGLDPLRAAVVMLSVYQQYEIRLRDSECYHLCTDLCLPQMKKEDFLNYWAEFLQEVPFLRAYVFDCFFQQYHNTEFITKYRLCLAVCLCCLKSLSVLL